MSYFLPNKIKRIRRDGLQRSPIEIPVRRVVFQIWRSKNVFCINAASFSDNKDISPTKKAITSLISRAVWRCNHLPKSYLTFFALKIGAFLHLLPFLRVLTDTWPNEAKQIARQFWSQMVRWQKRGLLPFCLARIENRERSTHRFLPP